MKMLEGNAAVGSEKGAQLHVPSREMDGAGRQAPVPILGTESRNIPNTHHGMLYKIKASAR